MESVLNQLYDGEIYPAEHVIPRAPEYRPLNRKIGEERERLKEKLSKEDGERLEDLHNDYCDVSCMCSFASFSYGFKLAALLMCEVFTDDEIRRGEG